jgi:hypothetical protein
MSDRQEVQDNQVQDRAQEAHPERQGLRESLRGLYSGLVRDRSLQSETGEPV